MCLYPQLLQNRKYTITKKNKGKIPVLKDSRQKYVAVGCGKCIECMKKKARDWNVRLNEDIINNKNAKFVTLTFAEESLDKFKNELKNTDEYEIENEIATRAVRLFLERYRKKYKKSLRHWLITEKGHKNTERIHLHGIIFIDDKTEIEKFWQYGWVYVGEYVNEKTINYIMKYVTKIDKIHKWFTGKILTSPGIGNNYTKRTASNLNNYKPDGKTNELYRTKTGKKIPLPIYYRNKLYSEKERELLWSEKLNKETRYVLGTEIDVSTPHGLNKYYKVLREAQTKNDRLGYGSINWKSNKYKKDSKKISEITKEFKEKDISSKCLTKNSNNDNNNHNGDINRLRDLGTF